MVVQALGTVMCMEVMSLEQSEAGEGGARMRARGEEENERGTSSRCRGDHVGRRGPAGGHASTYGLPSGE
jgi:hypothetical protein